MRGDRRRPDKRRPDGRGPVRHLRQRTSARVREQDIPLRPGRAFRRAEEQGVFADVTVRHGSVRSAIEDFVREMNASTLVLGAPGTGSEKKTFSPEELPRFAQEINANTGVEVILVS